jgi:hypothetical protein
MKVGFALLPNWGKAVCLCFLSGLLVNCVSDNAPSSGEPGFHPNGINLSLALTLSSPSGSLGSPVEARAVVENLGGAVRYVGGCACFQPFFELLDAEGQPVRLQDACAVQLGCPCWDETLEFGKSLAGVFSVEGEKWGDRCGEELVLPPGIYTVVASFAYEDGGHLKEIEKRASFEWKE